MKLLFLALAGLKLGKVTLTLGSMVLSLAIYAELDRDLDTSLAIGALLVALSVAILVSSKVIGRWRSESRSPSPSGPSPATWR